jgi:ABC-type multidrug transport system fused ATPase/permease subunit
MDKRFTAVRVLVVSVLAAYLLLGALSTGGVALPIGVLFLVLILWFSVYRFRHKGLRQRELVAKMQADLKGTLERIEERMAQVGARKRAAEEHEERARIEREERRVEREKRKTSMPARDPAMSRYAEMIENKVREGERTIREPEGQ